MIEEISSQAEIENLYKAGSNAPYTKIDKGYLGVLLVHKVTQETHCHICGKWFTNLGRHISSGHKMKLDDYRFTYGFPHSQPLCSPQLSAITSIHTRRRIKEGTLIPKGFKKGNKLNDKKKTYHRRRSASYENQQAICDEQVIHRVIGIAERTGEKLNSSLVQREDPALLALIFYRHNTWREFVKKAKLKVDVQRRASVDISNAVILEQLRRMERLEGQIPTTTIWKKKAKKYGFVSEPVIYKRFGSWNRALHDAGLFYEETK